MPLGEVCGMRGYSVGDHARLHVVAVGEAEMLLRRHVAKHGGAEPADHRRPNGARDVVVSRGDVGDQRPQRVERRLTAFFELLLDIDLDLVNGHVAGAFDYYLAAAIPRD